MQESGRFNIRTILIVVAFVSTLLALQIIPQLTTALAQSYGSYNNESPFNDGRVMDSLTSHIAVYCPSSALGFLRVWVVGPDGKGYTTSGKGFSLIKLVTAGPAGLSLGIPNSRGPNGRGTVHVVLDEDSNFIITWKGGEFGATGKGNFAASIQCP
jgi:hypothetical protein